MNRTGIDPLVGTNFEWNPIYCPRPTRNLQLSAPPVPPRPKQKKSKAVAKSTFQSHVVENWESHSPASAASDVEVARDALVDFGEKKKPSFHSHVKEGTT